MKLDDLTGKRFGRLVVISKSDKNNGGKTYWNCVCDCGNKCVVYANKLKSGETKSCGCIRKERLRNMTKTHGQRQTRIYGIYTNMKSRCNNKNMSEYHCYGGRGIKICEEWSGESGFENFYRWSMANGYNETLSIDRIDNNKDYSPENCRWATRIQQARNKNNNHKVLCNGKEYCISELLEIAKVKSPETIKRRLLYGWTVEEAINTKSKTYKGR